GRDSFIASAQLHAPRQRRASPAPPMGASVAPNSRYDALVTTETPAGPPMQRAARPALALLATYAGASVWAGVVDLREPWMVRDAMAGTPLTQAAMDAAVERQSQTFWAFLIVLVLTAIAF